MGKPTRWWEFRPGLPGSDVTDEEFPRHTSGMEYSDSPSGDDLLFFFPWSRLGRFNM